MALFNYQQVSLYLTIVPMAVEFVTAQEAILMYILLQWPLASPCDSYNDSDASTIFDCGVGILLYNLPILLELFFILFAPYYSRHNFLRPKSNVTYTTYTTRYGPVRCVNIPKFTLQHQGAFSLHSGSSPHPLHPLLHTH